MTVKLDLERLLVLKDKKYRVIASRMGCLFCKARSVKRFIFPRR